MYVCLVTKIESWGLRDDFIHRSKMGPKNVKLIRVIQLISHHIKPGCL